MQIQNTIGFGQNRKEIFSVLEPCFFWKKNMNLLSYSFPILVLFPFVFMLSFFFNLLFGIFDLWGRIDDKGKLHIQCNELLHCFQYFMSNTVSALKLRNHLQKTSNSLWQRPKQREEEKKKEKENYLPHF